jgi:hypothetical protein
MATKQEIQHRIAHFQKMEKKGMSSMLYSVEVQFIHMAQGGDGSAAMEGNTRDTYYSSWEDESFQTVCDEMGWEWREQ